MRSPIGVTDSIFKKILKKKIEKKKKSKNFFSSHIFDSDISHHTVVGSMTLHNVSDIDDFNTKTRTSYWFAFSSH